jgi:hypothetical protein
MLIGRNNESTDTDNAAKQQQAMLKKKQLLPRSWSARENTVALEKKIKKWTR